MKSVMPKNAAGRIKCLMDLHGIEPDEMAAAMRFSLSTYYGRMRDPKSLTLGEIELAAKKLKVRPETLICGGIEL